MKIVEDGVRRSLKDPNSAIFGDASAVLSDEGMIMVCGTVNARNSFGGYVGQQPYAGMLTRTNRVFVVAGMGGTESETYAVREVCRRHGLTV